MSNILPRPDVVFSIVTELFANKVDPLNVAVPVLLKKAPPIPVMVELALSSFTWMTTLFPFVASSLSPKIKISLAVNVLSFEMAPPPDTSYDVFTT